MAKVYFVPGLGTDVRIFSNLIPLLNIEDGDWECLEYRDPEHLDESIATYAQRLVASIGTLEEPPVLIGMSMGGTIVTEMAKAMPHRQLVIISSYKHKSEVPFLFKIARLFPVYRLVPAWLIRRVVPFFARLLFICDRKDSLVLRDMLFARTDLHFAWGRRAIVKWDNDWYPERFVHINGNRDHVFLSANKQITHLIKGGTHNIVLDRAEEVAKIINEAAFEDEM